MKTEDILKAAKVRLDAITTERAALDAEEQKLRRMLAAAEGQAEPVKTNEPSVREMLDELMRRVGTPPAGIWPPSIVFPQPPSYTPFQPVTPIWAGHGTHCACPFCVPPITCGGTISIDAQRASMQVLYAGDVPSYGEPPQSLTGPYGHDRYSVS